MGSDQYERLTLKHIRNLTAPGDKVLMPNRGVTKPHKSDVGLSSQLNMSSPPSSKHMPLFAGTVIK